VGAADSADRAASLGGLLEADRRAAVLRINKRVMRRTHPKANKREVRKAAGRADSGVEEVEWAAA